MKNCWVKYVSILVAAGLGLVDHSVYLLNKML